MLCVLILYISGHYIVIITLAITTLQLKSRPSCAHFSCCDVATYLKATSQSCLQCFLRINFLNSELLMYCHTYYKHVWASLVILFLSLKNLHIGLKAIINRHKFMSLQCPLRRTAIRSMFSEYSYGRFKTPSSKLNSPSWVLMVIGVSEGILRIDHDINLNSALRVEVINLALG